MAEKYIVRWSQSAVQDLDEIFEELADRASWDVAVQAYKTLTDGIESLTRNPRRCRTIPELKEVRGAEYRELIVSPYRICFRIRELNVMLLGIFDSRRDLEEILLNRALSLHY